MRKAGKYFIVLSIAFALAAAGCTRTFKMPVLHGYTLSNPENVTIADGSLRADLSLVLDLENPAGVPFSSDSLKIVLYRENGTIFGYATLRESVSIPEQTRQEVALPLQVDIVASPILLALNVFSKKGIDWSSLFIDVDGRVKAGSLKKKIHLERRSPKEMKGILENLKYEDTRQ